MKRSVLKLVFGSLLLGTGLATMTGWAMAQSTASGSSDAPASSGNASDNPAATQSGETAISNTGVAPPASGLPAGSQEAYTLPGPNNILPPTNIVTNGTNGLYQLPTNPPGAATTDYICAETCISSFAITTQGVLGRIRPDYDAKGVPLGGFRFFPSLDVGATYTDNVYYTNTDEKTDTIFTIAPRLDLQSQWARHAVELYAGLQQQQYVNFGSETQTNWDVGGSGRLDLLRGMDLLDNLSFQTNHEPRYSPDALGLQKDPTQFEVFHESLEGDYKPNNLGFQLIGTYEDYNYNDVPLIGGGILSNRDRDRGLLTGFAKVSYDFSPGYTVFVQSAYNDRNYSLHLDRSGVDRDSDGWRGDAGVDILLTHLIEGEFYVGYEDEEYKLPLQNVSGLDYEATVHWYATNLITVNIGAEHDIVDTILTGYSATNDQQLFVDADYELLRNLILRGTLTYSDTKFKGGIERDDNYWTFDLSAQYLINRYFSLNADYLFNTRASSVPFSQYNNNEISIGLTAHL